jgi:hypothetical protein
LLQQSAHVVSAMGSAGKNYLGRTSPKINSVALYEQKGYKGPLGRPACSARTPHDDTGGRFGDEIAGADKAGGQHTVGVDDTGTGDGTAATVPWAGRPCSPRTPHDDTGGRCGNETAGADKDRGQHIVYARRYRARAVPAHQRLHEPQHATPSRRSVTPCNHTAAPALVRRRFPSRRALSSSPNFLSTSTKASVLKLSNVAARRSLRSVVGRRCRDCPDGRALGSNSGRIAPPQS